MLVREHLVWAIAVCAAGCGDVPEAVSFDHAEGTASGLSDCICQYYDGTNGDLDLGLTCVGSNDTFDSISMFGDPNAVTVEGAGQILFFPSGDNTDFRAGAANTLHPIGAVTNSSDTKVIREIDGIEFRWYEQDACDAARGCQFRQLHLLAGALHAGHGGCEDYYATLRLNTGG